MRVDATINQSGQLHCSASLIPYLAEMEQRWVTGDSPLQVTRDFDADFELIRQLLCDAVDACEELEEARLICADLLLAAPTLLASRLTRRELVQYIDLALPVVLEYRGHEAIGRLLILKGVAELELQSLPAARCSFETARDAYEKAGNPQAAFRCAAHLGMILAFQGDIPKAHLILIEAKSFLSGCGDKFGLMKCIGAMSVVHQRRRQFAEAIATSEAYLNLAQELESRADEIIALGQLGTCSRRLAEQSRERGDEAAANEDAEVAIAYYRRQKELAVEHGDIAAQQRAIGNLGNAFGDLERFEEAIASHHESLHLATIQGNYRARAADQTSLGYDYLQCGNLDEAQQYLAQALSYYRSTNEPAYEALVLSNIALVAEAAGELESAVELENAALAIRERINDPRQSESREAIELWTQQLSFDRALQTDSGKAFDWDEVRAVTLVDFGHRRMVKVFDNAGQEWWFNRDQAPVLAGENDPVDSNETLFVSGSNAQGLVECYLAGES